MKRHPMTLHHDDSDADLKAKVEAYNAQVSEHIAEYQALEIARANTESEIAAGMVQPAQLSTSVKNAQRQNYELLLTERDLREEFETLRVRQVKKFADDFQELNARWPAQIEAEVSTRLEAAGMIGQGLVQAARLHPEWMNARLQLEELRRLKSKNERDAENTTALARIDADLQSLARNLTSTAA